MVAFKDLRYKKIFVAIKPERNKPQLLRDVSEGMHPRFTKDYLRNAIKRQTIAFGGGVDDLANLCEWIVDNDDEHPDNWMNMRPY